MTITVRAATRADADRISELNAVVHARHAEAYPWLFKPQGFGADAIARLIDQEATLIYLAEIDAAAAGYVYAEIQRVPEREITFAYEMLFIHQLGVHARYRRMGVARTLVCRVAEIAKAQSVERIGTSYWSFNSESEAFFASFGLAPYRVHAWR